MYASALACDSEEQTIKSSSSTAGHSIAHAPYDPQHPERRIQLAVGHLTDRSVLVTSQSDQDEPEWLEKWLRAYTTQLWWSQPAAVSASALVPPTTQPKTGRATPPSTAKPNRRTDNLSQAVTLI